MCDIGSAHDPAQNVMPIASSQVSEMAAYKRVLFPLHQTGFEGQHERHTTFVVCRVPGSIENAKQVITRQTPNNLPLNGPCKKPRIFVAGNKFDVGHAANMRVHKISQRETAQPEVKVYVNAEHLGSPRVADSL
eukprot:352421-Chlamydomonas_euryale.AAC.79